MKGIDNFIPYSTFRRSRAHRLLVESISKVLCFVLFTIQNMLFGALANAQQMDPNLFPRPTELEPAINFWVKVYTEVDTNNGFLHDSENLSVIYAQLERDNQQIEIRRQQIKDDLVVLASGKRSNLTENQETMLKLWPEGVSNQRLEHAVNNIRWQLGQSNAFLDGLQRSGAYRAYITEVLQNKDLPAELGLLPHVESSFNPNAYSSANAAGMWQFTRATGQRFMRIDQIIDERMDPYISADAAMDLLEYNYQVLGTWPLALTAYNQGVGGMSRAVRETGTTAIEEIIANYKGGRFRFVGRNFYAQFLAVHEVARDANLYFEDVRFAVPPEFIEVRLDAFIGAQEFANSIGTTINQLRTDNPSLRNVVWQGIKRIPRGFRLKLRAEQFSVEDNLLAKVNNDYKYSDQLPDIYYEVERGDNLQIIADRFDTTATQLAELNQLPNRNDIQVGQRLFLPQTNSELILSVPEEQIAAAEVVTPNNQNNNVIALTTLEAVPFSEDQPSTDTGTNDSFLNPTSTSSFDNSTPLTISPSSSNNDQALPIGPTVNNLDIESILDTDPSNYSVATNGTIEVQASETIGHLANWLDMPAWNIRQLNNMNFRDQIIIGKHIQLNFDRVSRENFELRRRNFHSDLQEDFFEAYRIRGAEEYQIQRYDNINRLAQNRYSAPLWLVRQYNPGIDFNSVHIGQMVTFPLLEVTESNSVN